MRRQPKVGDLVVATKPVKDISAFDKPGLVVDELELGGHNNLEVLFDDGSRAWFSDIEIKVLNE